MTIKEVETTLGITRANVRFYEKEGLLFPKRNPLNDYRDYSEEDLQVLQKILFLRNLDIPIETIRRLEQGNADLCEVLRQQADHFGDTKRQAGTSEAVCRRLSRDLSRNGSEKKRPSFSEFQPPDMPVPGKSLQDVLSGLWYFWDKLVAWGFLLIQLLYTVAVFPLLPEKIPVSWVGNTVTDEKNRFFFFVYLLVSVFFSHTLRLILYQKLVGVLRCYIDECNAAVTVGAIGFGFSMQIYTVLFLRGFAMSLDLFQLLCLAGYALLIAAIVLIDRKRRDK